MGRGGYNGIIALNITSGGAGGGEGGAWVVNDDLIKHCLK